MAEPQLTFTFRVPLGLGAAARLELGERVIDFIVARTRRGLDVNNAKFVKYSDVYINSIEFKQAGKSGVVDLSLSGDMLTDIEVLRHQFGSITIGFQTGTESNDKANFNENTRGDKDKPTREFLGITTPDLVRIINIYINENPLIQEAEARVALEAQVLLDKFQKEFFNNG